MGAPENESQQQQHQSEDEHVICQAKRSFVLVNPAVVSRVSLLLSVFYLATSLLLFIAIMSSLVLCHWQIFHLIFFYAKDVF